MQKLNLSGGGDVVPAHRLLIRLESERSLPVQLLEIAYLRLVLSESSAHSCSAYLLFTLFFDPARAISFTVFMYSVLREWLV